MSPHSAYFLVAHGSRDPRSHQAFQQLGEFLRRALIQQSDQMPLLQIGTLEFGSIPLEQQLCTWGKQLIEQNIEQLTILPLFLHPGVHVQVDIPAVVATVHHHLDARLQMVVRSHLGSHPAMVDLLREGMPPDQVDHWILLAHGSRHPGGNTPIQHLANHLGADCAYWSVPPSLRQQVAAMATQRGVRVGIKPYFLFTGSIIDAISQEVHRLKCDFKHINLILSSPLQPNPGLINLIQDLISA
ncbi:MAG: sirohydrochlorin chelatase [Acaryochloridaceae cyanobacterium CSU_3_4]|nr:sirohydrochlorin chelatase [Acaryochloridaceae cyanobacterium CSU_3_4]